MSIRSNEPFPHLVIDGFATPEICRAALAEWPARSWPHWLKYSGERGEKFASHDASRLTPACRLIVERIAGMLVERLLGVADSFPDLSLYGAGMSMILAGGEVPRHLDSDHHPITGWERAASAIVYLSNCQGGELLLYGARGERAEVAIEPRPGRLVLFACGDDAWHSVAPVLAGERQSASLFFWRQPSGGDRKRPRAEFV